jgi:hypothetical protein
MSKDTKARFCICREQAVCMLDIQRQYPAGYRISCLFSINPVVHLGFRSSSRDFIHSILIGDARWSKIQAFPFSSPAIRSEK